MIALPNDALKLRGLDIVAREAGWQEHTDKGQAGWRYPVFNAKGVQYQVDGKPAYRWKNAESNQGMKYRWLPGKPEGIRYYLFADTVSAIKEDGIVHLVSGEPDVLTMRAAGYKHALCWFDGEKSVPDTLADDLALLGARMAYGYPDRDETGMEAAAIVWRRLQGSEVAYVPLALPKEIGTKYDLNRLWVDCHFDAPLFKERLFSCAFIEDDELATWENRKPSAEYKQTLLNDTGLPQEFMDALIRDCEGQPGFRRWDDDGWGNFRCPVHEDSHNSAGFNRQSGSFKCFVCGDMSAKDYGKERGIILASFYDHTPTVEPTPPLLTLPQRTAPEMQAIGSHEAFSELMAELNGERLGDSEPMLNPYSVLHQFGGMAEILWTGKQVFISGISGGGKTSMGEFIGEGLLRDGDDYLWHGPEWNAKEMAMRSLQRDGGLDMTLIGKLRLWRYDEARGVPVEARRGIGPETLKVSESRQRLLNMLSWPGQAWYTPPGDWSLTQLLDYFADTVEAKRKIGRKVRALFFDYLQRAPKGGGPRSWDWSEYVVTQLRQFSEGHNLFSFVFIQPTKGASKQTRDGDLLNEASGQGVSDQQCNLYLTLTPAFDENRQRKPYAKFGVVKNSLGTTGSVFVKTAGDKLLVSNELADIRKVNTRDFDRDVLENF